MGLIPVPDAHLAAVVTSLEMKAKPRPRPMPDSDLRLVPWERPTPDKYRTLFARVGAPWLWFSRLVMEDARLTGIIHDPGVAIYAVADRTGIEVGLLELDYRVDGECELSFFGLVPELAGKGHGNWLMGRALTLAWRTGVARVWVHTCTLDHPGALNFYRRHGFVAYKRSVETFADPRTIGALPADSAPQIPCLAATTPR